MFNCFFRTHCQGRLMNKSDLISFHSYRYFTVCIGIFDIMSLFDAVWFLLCKFHFIIKGNINVSLNRYSFGEIWYWCITCIHYISLPSTCTCILLWMPPYQRMFNASRYWIIPSKSLHNYGFLKCISLRSACILLTHSETSPCFYVSAVQIFWKHCGKRRNCS